MNYKWSYIKCGNIEDNRIKNQRKYLIFFRKRLRKRLQLKILFLRLNKSEILVVSLNSVTKSLIVFNQ